MASPANANAQFGRSAHLYLTNDTEALDLSALHFKFQITANDVDTPNIARIRVYNLAPNTVAKAITEFSSVVVSAGYQNNEAQIFKGTIKQFWKGKETNVDRFLDIFAADGDINYINSLVNTNLSAPSTGQDNQFNTLQGALGLNADPQALANMTLGGIKPLPRGKVMFGLARYYMSKLSNSQSVRWSIQNGMLTVIPLNGYLDGDIVVLNSVTGLISVPEATAQGINVRCLLNPKISVGRRIQLTNADVTQAVIKQYNFPDYTDITSSLIAQIDSSTDGIYRVLVIEYSGDTRGQDWYCNLTCLALDSSSTSTPAVAPFG